MKKITVKVGQEAEITVPFSEVAMHMGIAGQRMIAQVLNQNNVQLLVPGTRKPFSMPILPGEAGLFRDSDGSFYFYDSEAKEGE